MTGLLPLLRRESPVTLIREMLWRARKRCKQKRLPALLEQQGEEIDFVPCEYYRPKLEFITADSRRVVRKYCEQILAGRFPRFGYRPTPLGSPPDWHTDFVSGKRWSLERSQTLRVVCFDGSDVKIPWDLSRLQFLPVLGKGWFLTGEHALRQYGMMLLADWIEKNPVNVGVNWTIAMEAALRGISICLFLDLLAPFSEEEEAWLLMATRSLREHFYFIEAHNEFSYFARSNHYLSNIVGLLCLSAHLSGPEMQRRFQQNRRLVEREISHQVLRDGMDYEASIGYHFFILQMFTTSFAHNAK